MLENPSNPPKTRIDA